MKKLKYSICFIAIVILLFIVSCNKQNDSSPQVSIVDNTSTQIQPTASKTITSTAIPTETITPSPTPITHCYPGIVYYDSDEDTSNAITNLVAGEAIVQGQQLTAKLTVQDIPDLVIRNQEEAVNTTEYTWTIEIDVDNNLDTGFNGVDYSLNILAYNVNSEKPISGSFYNLFCNDVKIWEGESDGRFIERGYGHLDVDDETNTIILSANISGISQDSRITFTTYNANPSGYPEKDFICDIDGR